MAVIADLTVDTLQAAAQQLPPPTGYDIGDKLTNGRTPTRSFQGRGGQQDA